MGDPDQVKRYLTEYVNRGFRKIFNEQRRIAAAKIYGRETRRSDGSPRSRSAALQDALASPRFNITGSGAGIEAVVTYPTSIRFLDMKRLGNYRIYNRPIWGILYKETFRDIRFEFEAWLNKNFADSIRECYPQ